MRDTAGGSVSQKAARRAAGNRSLIYDRYICDRYAYVASEGGGVGIDLSVPGG